jgi:hypothetical protein
MAATLWGSVLLTLLAMAVLAEFRLIQLFGEWIGVLR